MYVGREHPPPHFHAIYGEHEEQVVAKGKSVIRMGLAISARSLTLENPRYDSASSTFSYDATVEDDISDALASFADDRESPVVAQ